MSGFDPHLSFNRETYVNLRKRVLHGENPKVDHKFLEEILATGMYLELYCCVSCERDLFTKLHIQIKTVKDYFVDK
jgi:hypothetical protein